MDNVTVSLPNLLPGAEPFVAGRRSCKGCGKALAARIAAKTICGNAPVLSSPSARLHPPACVYDSLQSESMLENFLSLAESIDQAPADRDGSSCRVIPKPVIAFSRRILDEDFLAFAGVSEDRRSALYLCYDNESHLDAFIDAAGPQPFTCNDARHPISPGDVREMFFEKNLPALLADENFSYRATACTSFLSDYTEKIKRGLASAGSSFILVLTPCPTGWGFPSRLSHRLGAYAVQTGYFPLYEVEREKIVLSKEQSRDRTPVQQFLSLQRRFLTFPERLLPSLQSAVDSFWAEYIHERT